MAPNAKFTDHVLLPVNTEMNDTYDHTQAPFADVPHSNGKTQPWKGVWPPRRVGLQDVAESQGQMLLLDGTGGSGTKAVPNAVYLPPKSDKPEGDKKEEGKAAAPESEETKSEK
jgi:hypothetical protein